MPNRGVLNFDTFCYSQRIAEFKKCDVANLGVVFISTFIFAADHMAF